MGKNLIIKGADFSENSVPPIPVWNNEYEEPTENLFVAVSTNNAIGPNYEAGTKIDGIKLSLKPKSYPASEVRNLILGDIINIYLVDKNSPYSKTLVGSYTVTQSDLNTGFAIISINSVVISSSNFLGVGFASFEEGEEIYLPISVNDGLSGYFITSNNAIVSTIVAGIATYYNS